MSGDIAGDDSQFMLALGKRARASMQLLVEAGVDARAAVIGRIADGLEAGMAAVLAANAKDIAFARERGLSAAMIDRLMLDDERVAAIASAMRAIAQLPNPIGKILSSTQRPNGLSIDQVTVPLGVIGIIYESRPNVTADAAAICLKAANAVVLRGGSESVHSSRAIVEIVREALRAGGLPADAVQMLPSQDRALVGQLLGGLNGCIDVVVPRGGRALIERVQQDARVPVIGHLEGLCHIYLHASADATMAEEIVFNAKLRRTGICGAVETLLVDAALAPPIIQAVLGRLRAGGCELRGCERIRALDAGVVAASEQDWRTEYLDSILAVRMVDDIDAAIDHIREYGSGHTESIIAQDEKAAAEFLERVDSAIVMHNASTQFADGGEFGMGAEIGISTSRIHARGPVGPAQLVSYKYVVRGNGQTRP